MPDNKHNQPPELRQVGNIFFAIDGFDNTGGNAFRFGPEQTFFKLRRHRRINKTGLNGQDMDSLFRQTIAHPGDKSRYGRLGRSIDIVAAPAAVSRNG